MKDLSWCFERDVSPEAARRLPPGQHLTTKWPVLSYGETPAFDAARWSFRCFGLVEREVSWTWDEFLALPRAEIVADLHCVTKWTRLDVRWTGIPVQEVLRRVPLRPEARFAMVHADPDYTTNVPLATLVAAGALLAFEADGRPLEPGHGGPCRLVVPGLYFWKSAKWVRGFEFMDVNAPGFWECNGYHLDADPWKEERFSDQETNAMQRMRAEAAAKRRGRT